MSVLWLGNTKQKFSTYKNGPEQSWKGHTTDIVKWYLIYSFETFLTLKFCTNWSRWRTFQRAERILWWTRNRIKPALPTLDEIRGRVAWPSYVISFRNDLFRPCLFNSGSMFICLYFWLVNPSACHFMFLYLDVTVVIELVAQLIDEKWSQHAGCTISVQMYSSQMVG